MPAPFAFDRRFDLRASLLRPLALVWTHDRVIEMGFREFERRALNGAGGG
jgi:hypothetical protein